MTESSTCWNRRQKTFNVILHLCDFSHVVVSKNYENNSWHFYFILVVGIFLGSVNQTLITTKPIPTCRFYFSISMKQNKIQQLIIILSEFILLSSIILLTIRNICPGHRVIVLSTMIYVGFCHQANNSDKSDPDI